MLEPLPARVKTEQNTVGVSLFVKYEKLDSKLFELRLQRSYTLCVTILMVIKLSALHSMTIFLQM